MASCRTGPRGLQNLRARTYNPATGQFLTRDPLEQQTGQAYLYAGGDPVNGSDPSGACYIPNTHRDAALPGVQPDDQNCAISTVDDALSRILSTSKSPIYYPTEADKTCLYQQILRDIPGARSALPKGFYVSPARQVRTVIHRGGSVFDRAFTGVVAIGEDAVGVANEAAQAVAAAEGILQGAGQAVVEKPVIPLAEVLGAAATGFIAGIVTQPTLHDADTPENLLDSVKKLKYDEEDPNLPVVCFGIAIGTRLPGCSSLGPKLDAPGGLLVPQIALHILYAQLSGYPSVLTYNGPYPDDDPNSPTIMNRNAACGGRTEGATTESRARLKETDQLLGITRGRANTDSCDEYPFASTMQGGAGSSIAKVAGDQNRRQGTILSRFYGVALMQEPKPFRVHIIP
jgi:hypothetical protein